MLRALVEIGYQLRRILIGYAIGILCLGVLVAVAATFVGFFTEVEEEPINRLCNLAWYSPLPAFLVSQLLPDKQTRWRYRPPTH